MGKVKLYKTYIFENQHKKSDSFYVPIGTNILFFKSFWLLLSRVAPC